MQQIKPGIYVEDSYLGVTLGAIVYSHGIVMIDSPLRPEDARAWRSALLNQRGGTSRLLVSLDAHLDRTLGARALECTIVAHQKTALVFRNRPTIFKGQSTESGAEWETYDDAIGTRWAVPDITFSDHMILHWGGPDIILEHHPTSTPGSIWVISEAEKVVFVGDAITPNQPPFLANAELPEWIEETKLLLTKYRNYLVISGRGGQVTQEDIREQQRYLKTILRGMERLAERNASPESTENLIPKLLASIDVSPDQDELFNQRLRAGLYQYFIRHYRPTNSYSMQSGDQGDEKD
ncbi:MAG: MBL fold metallo-hydrolase [Anaerolineales bacterium]|nr:MAG: MBL fold metallo-hydrolase [Anaerolineales bacterium]